MIIMMAANSVSPIANPFVVATEPLDRVTWSLLMTALPFPERIPTYKTKRTPIAELRSGSKGPLGDEASSVTAGDPPPRTVSNIGQGASLLGDRARAGPQSPPDRDPPA